MPKRYILLKEGRADFNSIIGHIAKDNPAAAREMKATILKAFIMLGENPYLGQERRDLTRRPVRFWPVHRNYMIIYDAVQPVRILRIYNTARHITSILPQ